MLKHESFYNEYPFFSKFLSFLIEIKAHDHNFKNLNLKPY